MAKRGDVFASRSTHANNASSAARGCVDPGYFSNHQPSSLLILLSVSLPLSLSALMNGAGRCGIHPQLTSFRIAGFEFSAIDPVSEARLDVAD
jgi:hypothetical protein